MPGAGRCRHELERVEAGFRCKIPILTANGLQVCSSNRDAPNDQPQPLDSVGRSCVPVSSVVEGMPRPTTSPSGGPSATPATTTAPSSTLMGLRPLRHDWVGRHHPPQWRHRAGIRGTAGRPQDEAARRPEGLSNPSANPCVNRVLGNAPSKHDRTCTSPVEDVPGHLDRDLRDPVDTEPGSVPGGFGAHRTRSAGWR
jgi:hypothetical protein